ncbi:MAG TPA: hypothetical protein VJO53_12205 [Candidatus Acidoferrales bacterium]|nr:hypothetical protein [Candidatus Acidoferrales bacterium]
MMVDAEYRFDSGRSIARGTLVVPAGALIFLGIVFQLAMLGYGHLNTQNLWPAMMVVDSAWNLLAAHMGASGFREIFLFWPMALVAAGLAMLATFGRGDSTAPRN